MGATICLSIKNKNNRDYPTIILRKFFNMVFFEPDGKTITIYTATIFTGAESPGESTSFTEIPKPFYDSKNKCQLDFEYSKGKNIAKIEFENLSNSFFKQKKCIEQVWGECKDIESQESLYSALNELYPDIYADISKVTTPGFGENTAYMHILEKKKGKSHSCIVTEGNYSTENERNKYKYTLNCETNICVEAMNWVRTTITLKEKILDPKNNITFELNMPEKSVLCTPDFTWYFAPPTNYIVDDESAFLTIGESNAERNKISSVADSTTVDFSEWVTKERIDERKKARINFKDELANNFYGLSEKKISVKISFLNPRRHGNTQFIIGLIVAFLLGFCSDKSRLDSCLQHMNSYCNCSDCICEIMFNALGIAFPILIIVSFISTLFAQKRCLPRSGKIRNIIMIIFRWAGIISTLLLAVYIFVVWLVFPQIAGWLGINCFANRYIILTLIIFSLICNLIYTVYCGVVRKNKIIDFM